MLVKDAGTPETLGHSAEPLWAADLRLLLVDRTYNFGPLVEEYVAFSLCGGRITLCNPEG